jgi:hypothetical protein
MPKILIITILWTVTYRSILCLLYFPSAEKSALRNRETPLYTSFWQLIIIKLDKK